MIRLGDLFQEWRDAGPRPPQRLPRALQFPINDICNSGCQMCHIWKRKKDFELSPAQVRQVLTNSLFREVRGVGINGGEPTLRSDLPQVMEAVVQTLPRLEGVSLITNAIRARRVIDMVDQVGAICRNAGKKLDVMVSLDGVGKVHDQVRGTPGNFQAAVEVIDHLIQTRRVDSLRLGCTIIAENVFGLEELLVFAQRRGVYVRFRLGVPHPRLYTAELREPFAFSDEQAFHVAAFLDHLVADYERDPRRRAFYRSLRDQLVYGRARAVGCAWKNHGVTLGPRGELAYCAVASPPLGTVLHQSAEDVYWANRSVLQGIVERKCADCRHDYDGPPSRRAIVRGVMVAAARKLPATARRGLFRTVQSAWDLGEWLQAGVAPLLRVRRRGSFGGRDKILLCGWYGTETLGDRAILAALVRLWRDVTPKVDIELASLEPYVTRESCRVMPELDGVRVVSFAEAFARARQGAYGVVAVAGGPLMTPVREVIDLANLLAEGKRAGAATGVIGCGLGPIVGQGARRHAIARLVRDADVVIVRDQASAIKAKALGRRAEVEHAVDPAFLAGIFPGAEPNPRAAKKVVALALRDWPLSEYAPELDAEAGRKLKQRVHEQLLRFLDTLTAADVECKLVCMHTIPAGGDDRWFYARLLADRPEWEKAIGWRRRSPADEVALFHRADAVLAMRFHSCVFSLAMRKSFLALDYTRGGKVAALMRESGNEDRLLALDTFDGRMAATRLLADISTGRAPVEVPLEDSERIYRAGLHRLAQCLHR